MCLAALPEAMQTLTNSNRAQVWEPQHSITAALLLIVRRPVESTQPPPPLGDAIHNLQTAAVLPPADLMLTLLSSIWHWSLHHQKFAFDLQH